MPMTTPSQQLDIFADSPAVMLRNDVIGALLRRDADAASTACRQLAQAFPSDRDLPSMALLAEALRRSTDAPLTCLEAVALERQRLTDEIAPAAARTFSARDSALFMRPWWRLLAERGGSVAFRASRADDHAAALWLRGESWADAARAVEGIESWWRIPAPLAWMVEARCRMGQLDDCWALLAELAWLAPGRLDVVVRSAGEPLLRRLHRKFGERFDGDGDIADLAWFPAWVLTETPALAGRLGLARPSQDTPAERGMRLMIELLGLEHQGRHAAQIERRRALRDLSPPLWRAYMSTR